MFYLYTLLLILLQKMQYYLSGFYLVMKLRVSEIGYLQPEFYERNKLNPSLIEQGSFSFFAKFLPFLMIFQSSTALPLVKNGKK